MGNCLFEKLKGIVDNDNLLKVGEIEVNVSLSSQKNNVKINTIDEGTITLIGEGYIIQNGQNYKSIPQSNTYFSLPAGDYKLRITNKYKVVLLEAMEGVNIDDFEYMDSLSYVQGYNFTGDIKVLEKFKDNINFSMAVNNSMGITGNLTSVPGFIQNKDWRLQNTGVTGDISAFGTSGLKDCLISFSPGITGSLEGLVAALTQNGTTSGTKNLRLKGSGVTIGGVIQPLHDTVSKLVILSPTSYYYQDCTDADLNDSSKAGYVYAKNVPSSQVETWRNNNNTVTEF